MQILHLTLKRHWFDEIVKGNKLVEFREKKPYWTKRLKNREYDEIYFKNGYSNSVPFMRVRWLGCQEGKNKYMIYLGKILEIRNWDK